MANDKCVPGVSKHSLYDFSVFCTGLFFRIKKHTFAKKKQFTDK